LIDVFLTVFLTVLLTVFAIVFAFATFVPLPCVRSDRLCPLVRSSLLSARPSAVPAVIISDKVETKSKTTMKKFSFLFTQFRGAFSNRQSDALLLLVVDFFAI
jgi:hypothetical protein